MKNLRILLGTGINLAGIAVLLSHAGRGLLG
jgi:hypothetical protein